MNIIPLTSFGKTSLKKDEVMTKFSETSKKLFLHHRAVYRNFAKGGPIWGMDKRGGSAGRKPVVVSCEVLHSRGGRE